jgi:hypothetical protein
VSSDRPDLSLFANTRTHATSAWKGLSAALKDPLVYFFSFIAFFDLMGMGFVNFFPTWGKLFQKTFPRSLLTGFYQAHCNARFLHDDYPTFGSVGSVLYILPFPKSNLPEKHNRPPWVIAAIICVINGHHAGKSRKGIEDFVS